MKKRQLLTTFIKNHPHLMIIGISILMAGITAVVIDLATIDQAEAGYYWRKTT